VSGHPLHIALLIFDFVRARRTAVACWQSPPAAPAAACTAAPGRFPRSPREPIVQPELRTRTNRILKRRGLIEKKDSHAPAVERFERATPNELWQMDGKGEYRASNGRCYPLSIWDNHSPYAVGLYALQAFTVGPRGPVATATDQAFDTRSCQRVAEILRA